MLRPLDARRHIYHLCLNWYPLIRGGAALQLLQLAVIEDGMRGGLMTCGPYIDYINKFDSNCAYDQVVICIVVI